MPKEFKYRKDISYNGRRYSVRADTEVELYKKIAAKLIELESNEYKPATSSTTLEEYALHVYETYKRPHVTAGTYRRYLNRLQNCVINPLGHLRLQDVTRLHCQQALNAQAGNSVYQISQTLQMLTYIFKQAEIDGIIARSPVVGLVRPKGTKTTGRSMTDAEEQAFLTATQDNRYIVFLLSYYCGCRPNEARQLLGRDITIEDGQPYLAINGTKTAYSKRKVPLPSILYERIKKTPKKAFIAVNTAGNNYDEKAYQRAWHSLVREMNILLGAQTYRNKLVGELPVGADLIPYCLRHTYCTNLQKSGIDIRTAQYLMGHGSIDMTANIYTHIGAEQLKVAADCLNK